MASTKSMIGVDCWCKRRMGIPVGTTADSPYKCSCGREWYVAYAPDGPVAVYLGAPVEAELSDGSSSVPWWWRGRNCLAAWFWVWFTVLSFVMAVGLVPVSGKLLVLYLFFFLAALASPHVKNKERR